MSFLISLLSLSLSLSPCYVAHSLFYVMQRVRVEKIITTIAWRVRVLSDIYGNKMRVNMVYCTSGRATYLRVRRRYSLDIQNGVTGRQHKKKELGRPERAARGR